jgi:hypothetical protein
MKLRFLLNVLPLLLVSHLVIAANYTINVSTTMIGSESYPSLSLFDSFGRPTNITGNFQWLEYVDSNGDGSADYSRVQITFLDVPPGSYSVCWSYEGSRYWTAIYDLTNPPVGFEFGEFSLNAAPQALTSDLVVSGSFDVRGNLMNFGSDNYGRAGVQLQFDPVMNSLNTNFVSLYADSPSTPARSTWTFGNELATMTLESRGKLWVMGRPSGHSIELDATIGMIKINGNAPIELNATTGAIKINGNAVATKAELQSNALSSLRLGGGTVANLGSIASGANSAASGLYSAAIGYGANANSLGMIALGFCNTITSGQSVNNWVPTDDLFVIGNGTFPTSRSNAVTIKKDGTTSLHGSVFVGTPSTGSLSFLGGTGQRSMSIGEAATGTNLLIAAGGASVVDNPGGTLILSSGAVQPGGVGTAGSSILFRTADANSGGTPNTRMSVDAGGNVVIGSTVAAPLGQKGQLVIGSHNVAKPGSFVVGGGTGVPADPANVRNFNAFRISDEGMVLVKPGGDIDMGEFIAGEQP